MHCSIHEDLFKDTVIKRCGHMFSEKAVTVSRHCAWLLNSSRLLTCARGPSALLVDQELIENRNRKCPLCNEKFDKTDALRVFWTST